MSVQIQLRPGEKLVTKTSTKFPKESFVSIERVPTNRVWWKFWLPTSLLSYTVVEKT